MKVGMKEDRGVANEMSFVLGSRACSAQNCARSAPKCTYSQSMVARIIGF